MRAYTNVIFNRYEVQVIEKGSLHLDVAFPKVRTEMPKKRSERHPDHEARVVFQLIRDRTQGTYENVTHAVKVMQRLVEVLKTESELTYWLDDTEQRTGKRPTPADEPTSPYQQLRTLADIRAGQITDAEDALAVLRQAAAIVKPSVVDSDDEYDSYEFDHTTLPLNA